MYGEIDTRFHSRALVLSAVLLAAFDNLDYGLPGNCDQVIHREGYALGYCEAYEQPLWVAYRLTADEVTNVVVGRVGSFYADGEIITGSASPRDYIRSGYDRGHLAPAADMRFATNVMEESFSMANVCPQVPSLNRGVWRRIEDAVRELAVREGSVYVIAGPIFLTNAVARYIGLNAVRVPDSFYKVVLVESDTPYEISYLIPNVATNLPPEAYIVPPSEIKAASDMNVVFTKTNNISTRER